MNTYLFSIHPKWVEKIFNGEKTIEVRKSAPKPPFKVVVYCTKAKNTLYRTANGNYAMAGYEVKGDIITLYCEKEMTLTKFNGKVIGEFICDETDTYQYEDSRQLMLGTYHNKELLLYETCLTSQELDNYAKGKVVKLLHITSPRLYDKPKELGEFYSIKQCKPEYSPFGYQWTWEDRHKRHTGGRKNEYRPVPIECHRCKSLVGGKDYLDEKSGCILFDYECISNYHKPLARPPQSYMRIQDAKED